MYLDAAGFEMTSCKDAVLRGGMKTYNVKIFALNSDHDPSGQECLVQAQSLKEAVEKALEGAGVSGSLMGPMGTDRNEFRVGGASKPTHRVTVAEQPPAGRAP